MHLSRQIFYFTFGRDKCSINRCYQRFVYPLDYLIIVNGETFIISTVLKMTFIIFKSTYSKKVSTCKEKIQNI